MKFCFSLNRNDLAFGGAQLERIQQFSDLVRVAEMVINQKGCSRNIFPVFDSQSHHAGIIKRKIGPTTGLILQITTLFPGNLCD